MSITAERKQALLKDSVTRLLKERASGAPGTVVTCALEGSRPLLVEVQALVGGNTNPTPSRTAVGIDRQRLSLLLAVLGKAGLPLSDHDVFVSVAGGVRIGEPAVDLAVAVAIHSSFTGQLVPDDLIVFGEIGLVGELRGVSQPLARLREAERHGFRTALVPGTTPEDSGSIRLRRCGMLREVME